ncbi:GMC family oxidoreductase [Marinobacter mobilis]|uniref:Cholesterol oxidase n=1 Tax=Marinobacter mobilis TaxID=488533 RepID=A0A1H2ZD51_9GAMM|nr:GMC family oxidoreductase [Marinobacter mobilis]SDX15266.1 cholesterol oxidase [Marinobacter mobilis]
MSADNNQYDYDYIVVGSGFGGSVSACRLSEKGYSVAVMEMGRRWTPENLPKSNWNLRNWLWRPMLGLRGFFNTSFFRHVIVLHGNAVGGGSITYANTLLVPPDKVWDEGSWAGINDWQAVMPGFYDTAKRTLGVVRNPMIAPADRALKTMADAYGVGDTWYPTDVGVFFGNPGDEPGTRYEDPFFDGRGPARNSCIGCGGCMVGCRHNAKNTLDKNYLYLAEQQGARVYPETKVVDVVPLNGHADGRDGYEVTTVPPTWRGVGLGIGKRTWRCRSIIFSGSSLGTQELLFKLKEKGSLPRISDELGKRVRTNAESLIVVRRPDCEENMSDGIAIGSGIHIDEHTHIEATRYPAGSDFMGMMLTALTHGRPGWTRPLFWLWMAIKIVARNPLRALRAQLPFGWARETIIFLCMQTIDGHLNMRLKRLWYWPFRKALVTEGDRIPTFIPEANAFAEKAASAVNGLAGSSLPEIFFNTPTTAHCMGGCSMADSPEHGVIDGRNRVFGYQNMLVCDGSMLGANLGVNPSLTITALTEHAMSHIPDK